MDTGVLYLQSELLERRDVKKTLDTECPEYLEHYAITVITVSYLEPGQERKQHNTHVLEDDLGNVRRSLISIAKKKKSRAEKRREQNKFAIRSYQCRR